MPVENLYLVTEAILTVIKDAVSAEGSYSRDNVYSTLPDRNEQNGIGFYLYYVRENAHNKHQPPPGPGHPPVKYTPMALDLCYQLSATHKSETGDYSAEDEQKMMSIAIKALHDNPVIVSLGEENRFTITLQHLPINEAIQFWGAAQSPVKLSSFYEVSVVFLKPEERKKRTGTVLSYGAYVFPGGVPQITGTQAMLSFKIPGETATRKIRTEPAQVITGNEFEINGSGFTPGAMEILLHSAAWNRPAIFAATDIISATDTKIVIKVPVKIKLIPPVEPDKDVLPGLYAVQINVIRNLSLPGEAAREIKNSSNQFPLKISPDVQRPSNNPFVPDATGSINVVGGPFTPADKVQVYTGGISLTQVATAATPATGEYNISTTGDIVAKLPGGLGTARTVPLLILVNGAESPPRWINIP